LTKITYRIKKVSSQRSKEIPWTLSTL